MSQDAERIKRLIEFKQKIEKRIEELDSELKEMQAILEAVNSILLEKGFKRAEITKPVAVAEVPPPKGATTENVVELKATNGELLATLYISEDSLRVLPAEGLNFNVNTPPFTTFLVERVLAKMQEKDSELAKTGHLEPEKIFSYTILTDGDVLREIIVKNVGEDRLRELKSSIRWTLEKMYEKMKSQS
ncbi:MAG: hypothetical protein QW667_06990 [Candidatus Bathyarchaeia archaeon]